MCKIDTFCPYCDIEVTAELVQEKETLPVLGKPVEYIATLAICPKCGNAIGDARVEGKNLERAYDKYAEIYGETVEDARKSRQPKA